MQVVGHRSVKQIWDVVPMLQRAAALSSYLRLCVLALRCIYGWMFSARFRASCPMHWKIDLIFGVRWVNLLSLLLLLDYRVWDFMSVSIRVRKCCLSVNSVYTVKRCHVLQCLFVRAVGLFDIQRVWYFRQFYFFQNVCAFVCTCTCND